MKLRGIRQASSGADSGSNSSSAFMALCDKVQGLTFRPFLVCVMVWMGRKGFRFLKPLGRVHRRGRKPNGGADLVALLPDSEIKVAVSIRHWKSPLQRRAVDELWGHLLRNQVPTGLIVTSSTVMESARRAADSFPGRPIQIVSYRQLCSSMASLELGIRKSCGCWVVDESFFESLQTLTLGSSLKQPIATGHLSRSLDGLASLTDEPSELLSAGQASSFRWWILAIAAAVVLVAVLALKGT